MPCKSAYYIYWCRHYLFTFLLFYSFAFLLLQQNAQPIRIPFTSQPLVCLRAA